MNKDIRNVDLHKRKYVYNSDSLGLLLSTLPRDILPPTYRMIERSLIGGAHLRPQ